MPIVNLTARYVDTVKATGSRLEIRDKKVEGFELRVTPAGSKSWVLRYRRLSDRAKRTYTLGTYPDTSLEDAREAAEEARREVAKGGDPAGGKAAAKAAPTFRELASDWQDNYAATNRSLRVRQDDQSVLNLYILPVIGSMKAHAIQRQDIGKLLNAAKRATDGRKGHRKKGAEPRPLTHRPNKVFEVVRAIMRWAVSEGILAADPTLGRKRPIKKEKARERDLSADEVRKLWLALDQAPIERQRAADGTLLPRQAGDLPMSKATALAMKLSLVTAQRIGEVSGTPIAELDLNDVAPVWTISGSRTKNSEPHRVPLSRLAVALIKEARALGAHSKWLFPSPTEEGPTDPHAATRALARARPSIGLADFRVHDLRRTAASRMGEMGVRPHVIAHVLNHISVTKGTVTGKNYNQYTYDPEKRDALDRWGGRLEKIIAGTDGDNVATFPEMERTAV